MEHHTIPLKTCKKCNQQLPATTDFFARQTASNDGLQTWCKPCKRAYQQANTEHQRKKDCEYRQANKDKISEQRRGYRQSHKNEIAERGRQYRQANKDKIAEKNREYREANRDKFAEWQRTWRTRHRDKLTTYYQEYLREYRPANRDRYRIAEQRRRTRKLSLPDLFTPEQWQVCLEYHHFCCAVCGNQLRDLFGEIKSHADHWIPLSSSDCPGTIATNMICLCSKCNQRKNASMPDIWLIQTYGTRKANEILKRVASYFEWVSTQT